MGLALTLGGVSRMSKPLPRLGDWTLCESRPVGQPLGPEPPPSV